jgi:predicted acetyltransferase
VAALDLATPASTRGTVNPPETEIRLARDAEIAGAKALQRDAFGLESVDGHRFTQEEETRVVVRGGRVVSCLNLMHADIGVSGATLRMGGIRLVTTHPEEQNNGYAGSLLRTTLKDLCNAGVGASILFPFSFRYYRKFGFELGGNACHVWCRPNSLPGFRERELCRRATPADTNALAAFDARRARSTSCFLHRSPERWSLLLNAPDLEVNVVPCATGLCGYSVTAEGRDNYGGRIVRVLDLAATERKGWRALLGYAARSGAESIEWNACAEDVAASGLLTSVAPLREGFKPRSIVTVRPMFQFRVVCLESALRAWAAAQSGGAYRLAIKVQDDLLERNQRSWTLVGNGDWTEVRPARPGDPYLEADIRVFSQLFCGFLSAGDAISQGLVKCSPAAEEAAEELFPGGQTFIPELDRF